MVEHFFDKYQRIIHINDILKFDNGSSYKLINYKGEAYLKCITKRMPLLKADKMVLDKTFVSGIKVDKY